MKELKIETLTISNFRAMDKVVEFGNETQLSGENKKGKTTVYNAFLWLLTGYDNNDMLNHKLFNTMVEQTPENALQCSVEGSFTLDGKKMKIKRTADIGWTKRRGSTEYTRSGSDKYHTYIDGVEYNATEFKDFLNNNIGEQRLLRIMLNGFSFLKEDWKVQRKMLVELFQDEIDSKLNDKYQDVISQINERGGKDKVLRYISSEKSDCKKLIDSYDSKIEELTDQMEDKTLDDENIEKISSLEIDEGLLKTNIDEVTNQPVLENKELKDLRALYLRKSKEYDASIKSKKDTLRKEISALEKEYNKALLAYEEQERNKTKIALDKENYKNLLDQLNKERKLNKKHFDDLKEEYFITEVCQACGQPLPQDKLDELEKVFNENKKEKANDILAKGKRDKAKYEEIKAKYDALEDSTTSLLEKPVKPSKIEELKKELSLINDDFSSTDEGKDIINKSKEVTKNDGLKEKEAKLKELNDKLKDVRNEIVTLKMTLGVSKRNEDRIKRIQNHKVSKRNTAIHKADVEQLEDSLKSYEQERAKLMQQKMDSLFTFCSIALTKPKKDGTYEDTCEIVYDGDYSVLNDGGRIIASIDIQRAFQKVLGIVLPLWVDRAESLTTKFTHDGQIVYLRTTNEEFLNQTILK